MFKDYDKNVVFKNCQMHFLKYLFEKKGDPFGFLASFCLTSCQTKPRYWTTFETLADIERDCKEGQLFM